MTFEDAVVEEFRSGRIVDHDLDGNGISEMSVVVAGKTVEASWYSPFVFGRGSPRSVRIDGRSYPSAIGRIVRAAQIRAEGLIDEDMRELDELVK